VDTKLYLQHDLSVVQLAKTIGTNRLYLSQYFSCQGTTYNAYINDLRIGHFVSLYREAAADKRNFTAQQLANECGYRSYSTFTLAFKQRMGQSVTAWMREMD
jgi:AraC-like DNA-binding protein